MSVGGSLSIDLSELMMMLMMTVTRWQWYLISDDCKKMKCDYQLLLLSIIEIIKIPNLSTLLIWWWWWWWWPCWVIVVAVATGVSEIGTLPCHWMPVVAECGRQLITVCRYAGGAAIDHGVGRLVERHGSGYSWAKCKNWLFLCLVSMHKLSIILHWCE